MMSLYIYIYIMTVSAVLRWCLYNITTCKKTQEFKRFSTGSCTRLLLKPLQQLLATATYQTQPIQIQKRQKIVLPVLYYDSVYTMHAIQLPLSNTAKLHIKMLEKCLTCPVLWLCLDPRKSPSNAPPRSVRRRRKLTCSLDAC